MKIITKDRLVSGGIGAAAIALGYGLWGHFHRQPRHAPQHGHAPHEEQSENERGEYGHKKHHHHKEG